VTAFCFEWQNNQFVTSKKQMVQTSVHLKPPGNSRKEGTRGMCDVLKKKRLQVGQKNCSWESEGVSNVSTHIAYTYFLLHAELLKSYIGWEEELTELLNIPAECWTTGISFLLLQLLKQWFSRNFADTMPLENSPTPPFVFPTVSNRKRDTCANFWRESGTRATYFQIIEIVGR
jgi:hypothetical protein